MDSKLKALKAARIARDTKAQDIVILDMRQVSNFCNYFVICSATSLKRTQAIAEAIEEKFSHYNFVHRPIQGRHEASWILLDYEDVIVHIFYHEARDFYDLEYLWKDAPQVDLTFSHR